MEDFKTCVELAEQLEKDYYALHPDTKNAEPKRRTRKEMMSEEEWRFWCDEHQ